MKDIWKLFEELRIKSDAYKQQIHVFNGNGMPANKRKLERGNKALLKALKELETYLKRE